MAELRNGFGQAQVRPSAGVQAYDEGLRTYMLKVYNYMAGGVLLTGLVAMAVYALSVTTDPAQAVAAGGRALARGQYLTPFGYAMFASPLKWVVALAPLGIVLLISFRIHKMSVAQAQFWFWAYAALVGASLSVMLLVFTHTSIARVFFITAASFSALSLWGYTTKRDISGWGSFLFMGVIGLALAMIANMIWPSAGLGFAISAIGVLVFAGLTAYDTQTIKESYSANFDGTALGHAAIMGALQLYLDFINMFQFLLQLLGDRE